jgi:hypothetical protein
MMRLGMLQYYANDVRLTWDGVQWEVKVVLPNGSGVVRTGPTPMVCVKAALEWLREVTP